MRKESLGRFLLKIGLGVFVGVFATLLSLFASGVLLASLAEVTSFEDYDRPPAYVTIFGESDGQKLLSIPVTGLILGEKEDISDPLQLFDISVTYGYDVQKKLLIAADDQSIKGVVLEINSPGGTIYGSRAIADGVKKYKEQTGKPVVAFVRGLAASGGYWAGLPSDMIVADYGSTIGSIGVLFGPFKYYDSVVSEDGGVFIGGVVTEDGITTTYITAGTSKDLGNPYRALTDREIAVLQESVDNEYNSFVSAVHESRGIEEAVIRSEIGALIYDPLQSQSLGLIDETTSKDGAYGILADLASLEAYRVVSEEKEPTLVETLLSSQLGKQVTTFSCPKYLSSLPLAYYGDLLMICE